VLFFWIGFNLFVIVMLTLDLGVFNRRAHSIGFREALRWSALWVTLAAAFGCIVYFWHGRTSSLEFATAYLIELSLSIDNLFVFLVIFRYFRVPDELQHRVLFWGILGALITRGVFIVAGVGLIQRFHWIIYVFGALLVWSGIKLLHEADQEIHPENNPLLRVFRRWIPVTEDYVGNKFWVRRPGLYATPLVVVLLVVETTDVLFAVDSIPAVLAITLDAFIVYTSNVFAIMGLRSMYFAVAGMLDLFEYLHYGLSAVLILIGGKMLASHYYTVPTHIALATVVAVLAISVAASLAFPKKRRA
jgi:tellurite resistance protein TerC